MGTGSVGRLALREVLKNPEFQLAGVKVYGDAKVGKDAGELCGLPPAGVIASKEPAVARGDTILYCPIVADYDEIARLLRAGRMSSPPPATSIRNSMGPASTTRSTMPASPAARPSTVRASIRPS